MSQLQRKCSLVPAPPPPVQLSQSEFGSPHFQPWVSYDRLALALPFHKCECVEGVMDGRNCHPGKTILPWIQLPGCFLLDSPLPTGTFTASIIGLGQPKSCLWPNHPCTSPCTLKLSPMSCPRTWWCKRVPSQTRPLFHPCASLWSLCGLFPKAIHSSLCKRQWDYPSSLSCSHMRLRQKNSRTKEGSA